MVILLDILKSAQRKLKIIPKINTFQQKANLFIKQIDLNSKDLLLKSRIISRIHLIHQIISKKKNYWQGYWITDIVIQVVAKYQFTIHKKFKNYKDTILWSTKKTKKTIEITGNQYQLLQIKIF